MCLYFKFNKQTFRVFRGPYEISSFFVKKLSVSVFLVKQCWKQVFQIYQWWTVSFNVSCFFSVQNSDLRNSCFVFIGTNDIIRLVSLKESFFRFPLFQINEGEICGILSTKKFDCKIFLQVSITVLNLKLAISCKQGPMDFFKVLFQKLFPFVLFLFTCVKQKHFRSTWAENFLFCTFLILCCIPLYFKFKMQPFRVFRGLYEISSFFFKKICFSVLFVKLY